MHLHVHADSHCTARALCSTRGSVPVRCGMPLLPLAPVWQRVLASCLTIAWWCAGHDPYAMTATRATHVRCVVAFPRARGVGGAS